MIAEAVSESQRMSTEEMEAQLQVIILKCHLIILYYIYIYYILYTQVSSDYTQVSAVLSIIDDLCAAHDTC